MYLAGRQRAGKEMNGKSANLNNCLRQLYPGDHPVPASEVVCIFDADQARLVTLVRLMGTMLSL